MAPFCPSSAGSTLPMLLGQFSRARHDCQAAHTLWLLPAKCGRQARTQHGSTVSSAWRFCALCYRAWLSAGAWLPSHTSDESPSLKRRNGCLPQPAPARLRLSRGAPRHTEYRHRTVRVAQTQHRAPLTRHRFPRRLSPNSTLRELCCKVAVLKKREILKNI